MAKKRSKWQPKLNRQGSQKPGCWEQVGANREEAREGWGGLQSDARWEKSHEGLIVTPREDSFGPEV